MNRLTAFPASGHVAKWSTWDGAHDHTLTLTWENEAWTAFGQVGRENLEFVIRLSPLWRVQQFLLFRDMDDPDLWLGTDGKGRWGEMNGEHRTDLDGCHAIALACSPFTHTIPLRGHALAIGDSIEVKVVDVDVEILAVTPEVLVYCRLSETSWRVTGGNVVTEFDVDEYALPIDVVDSFRRIS